MLKAKRPTDSSAGTKTHRHPFWNRTAPAQNQPPVSEAETIKHKTHHQTGKSVVAGPTRAQPVPIASITTTYSRQNSNSVSNTFNVVRGNSGYPNTLDSRNAVSTSVIGGNTSAPAPIQRVQAPVPVPRQQQQQQQQQQAVFAKNNNISSISSSKPDASAHRVSIQSLNSLNTASTSRSSFECISTENLQHSWGSTTPSSTIPHSTDSLSRIPAASETRDNSRRFPLVESDGQRKHVEPSSKTHGDTQGEQVSNALPLPNSEYESPARVRSLRRSKPNINLLTPSVRVATSTTGRQSPAPEQITATPPMHQGQHHQRSKSDMLPLTELAYVRPSRTEEHARLGAGDNRQATLLARVMATSSARHTHSVRHLFESNNLHSFFPDVLTFLLIDPFTNSGFIFHI
jgi:hypothetical protein